MPRKLLKERPGLKLKITASDLSRKATWGGYNQPYVQNIVKGAMKALKVLATLTFDPGLYFWTNGLQKHLENRIEEARREKEKEEAELRKYTFH